MASTEGEVAKTGVWKHGLCGCFDNLGICIITYFVPCVTFGQTAQGLGKSCVLHGCLFLLPIVDCVVGTQQRGQIRGLRGIPGSAVKDCCTFCWCSLCAIVQQAQEMEHIKKEGGGIAGGTTVVITTTTTTTTKETEVKAEPYDEKQPLDSQEMDRD